MSYEKPTGIDPEVVKVGEDARREEWLNAMQAIVPDELASEADLEELYIGETPVWLEPYDDDSRERYEAVVQKIFDWERRIDEESAQKRRDHLLGKLPQPKVIE